MTGRSNSRAGLLYGLGAYTAWGVMPLYFRALASVSPWVILCHRIFWSALFLVVVVSLRREWTCIVSVLRNRRKLLLLLIGAILIALNWLIFIYAVVSGQVLQASLGYFINPLLSIALGLVFLREKLRPWQWVAVLIAAAAVANLTVRSATFPWIAVSLAGSFGFYGLVRKKVNLNSLHGLLVETAILLAPAIIVILLGIGGKISHANWGLLSLSGVITAVPLLMFGEAVRLLKLSTVGFLQYIGPTLQFLVALLLLHERLDPAKLTSFVVCWSAIAVYVADSIRHHYPQPLADKPE